jgi:di/tripeptidase
LNAEQNIILSPSYFKDLLQYKGQTLTDGTTLLGADDKAGITEIVTAMEFLIKIQTSNTEKLESVSHLMKKLDVAHTLM